MGYETRVSQEDLDERYKELKKKSTFLKSHLNLFKSEVVSLRNATSDAAEKSEIDAVVTDLKAFVAAL